MATPANDRFIEHLRQVVLYGHDSPLSDGDLLGRFGQERDEGSFAVLVRRHAHMVFGVCHRVLRQRSYCVGNKSLTTRTTFDRRVLARG